MLQVEKRQRRGFRKMDACGPYPGFPHPPPSSAYPTHGEFNTRKRHLMDQKGNGHNKTLQSDYASNVEGESRKGTTPAFWQSYNFLFFENCSMQKFGIIEYFVFFSEPINSIVRFLSDQKYTEPNRSIISWKASHKHKTID